MPCKKRLENSGINRYEGGQSEYPGSKFFVRSRLALHDVAPASFGHPQSDGDGLLWTPSQYIERGRQFGIYDLAGVRNGLVAKQAHAVALIEPVDLLANPYWRGVQKVKATE